MITIPSYLEEILDGQSDEARACRAAVDGSLAEFEPLLKKNETPFFPEYTDHGVEHVAGVIRTAEALIADRTRRAAILTPADAAVLVLACLLHDLAMHLSKDGFVSLVTAEDGWDVVPALGDRPWPRLWDDFSAEAKRFDGRTLKETFGSPDPDGRLPLNLKRNDLRRPLPFLDALRRSVLEDLLAFALVRGPATPIRDRESLAAYLGVVHPSRTANTLRYTFFPSVVGTPGGVTLCDPWLLKQALGSSVMVLPVLPPHSPDYPRINDVLERHPIVAKAGWFCFFEEPGENISAADAARFRGLLPLAGCRVLLHKQHNPRGQPLGGWPRRIKIIGDPERRPKALGERNLEAISEGTLPLQDTLELPDGWIVLSFGECREGFDFCRFAERELLSHDALPSFWGFGEFAVMPGSGKVVSFSIVAEFWVAEWFLPEEAEVEMSAVSEPWMEVFGTPAIPYDPAERREKLSHAYERLAEYVAAWEAEE